MGKVRLNCNECGKFVWRYNSQVNDKNFCNKKCCKDWNIFHKSRIALTLCNFCNNIFYKSIRELGDFNFCNASCRGSYDFTKLQYPVKIKDHNCHNCTEPLIRDTTYESIDQFLNRKYCDRNCHAEDMKLPEQERLRRRRNREKIISKRRREKLYDNYIKTLITTRIGTPRELISDKFVALKRKQLKLHRRLQHEKS